MYQPDDYGTSHRKRCKHLLPLVMVSAVQREIAGILNRAFHCVWRECMDPAAAGDASIDGSLMEALRNKNTHAASLGRLYKQASLFYPLFASVSSLTCR